MSNIDSCIISSLLDDDLYKFSMQNAVFRLFPDAVVEYRFIDRGETPWGSSFVDRLKEQIQAYCELKFTKDEIDFLRSKCPYFYRYYLEWLESYRPDPGEILIHGEGEDLQGIRD